MADEAPRLPRLPMCLPGFRPGGKRLGAWPMPAILALVLLLLLVLRAAVTVWPDQGPVPATFRAAIVDLQSTADDLTPSMRNAVGATTQLLIERGRSTLEGLERLPVPLTDAATARHLVFAEDAMRAAAGELGRAGERGIGATAASIETLASEALRRLGRIDLVLAERQEQLADSMVWLENDGIRWLVWRLDRTLYDAIRGLGVVLLLGGCLAIALRLLDKSRPLPTLQQLREAGPANVLGAAAFTTFLVGSVGLALEPTVVPGISPSLTSLPRSGPCGQLETARAVFWEAEESGIEAFSDAVERRLQQDARDCLDLGTAVAARDATERFLVRLDDAPASSPPVVPSAAPPAVSLALMPAIHDDVARLRASVEDLLGEVARLRAERLTRVAHANGQAAMDGEAAGSDAGTAEEQQIAATGTQPVAEPSPGAEASEEVAPAPATSAPRPFVTTTALNYRTGPSARARRLGTLPEGTRVRMVSESDGWANVRLHDGRAAYVSREFIRPVE